ncbi:QRFP-like peptide receptor [Haliotis cracherodii]|uniref:QRFP-like peptide receptor n=1 Tax=Haliotis cracherodii TaxID=6455 RepID=UPI0039EC9AF2
MAPEREEAGLISGCIPFSHSTGRQLIRGLDNWKKINKEELLKPDARTSTRLTNFGYGSIMNGNVTVTSLTLLMGTEMPTNDSYAVLGGNESDNRTGPSPVQSSPEYLLAWVTVANVLVFITGVFGNTLVIIVVSRVREMKTATNFCLMNLSIADLLVLLICQPAALLEFFCYEKWMLGDFMCRLVSFLENFVTHASIMIILAVSLGRFFAVAHPLRTYSSGSKSKAMLIMVVIWIVVLAVTSPFLVMAHTTEEYHFIYQEYVSICITPINQNWKTVYMVIIFCCFFVVPMALLVFLYTFIIYKVVKDTMMSGDVKDSAKVQSNNSRKQLVSMLIGIIVLFFSCLLPFRIVALWQIFTPLEKVRSMGVEQYQNLMAFVRLLIYVNSAGNPIIYNIYSQKFRNSFRKALVCGSKNDLSNAMRRTTVTNYSYVKSDVSQVDYV